MKYPLYHGTSTHFLQDIEVHGLGGRNIARDWRAAEFLREVWDHALARDQAGELAARAWHVERMLTDWDLPTSPTGANWRHGGLYLTTSRHAAERYAGNAGPEMAKEALDILAGADAPTSAFLRQALHRYPEISAWQADQVAPLVIEVQELDEHLLRWEDGSHVDPIEELRTFDAQPDVVRISCPLSFEYKGIVPFEHVIVHRLDG